MSVGGVLYRLLPEPTEIGICVVQKVILRRADLSELRKRMKQTSVKHLGSE